jgi:hypothetical protein
MSGKKPPRRAEKTSKYLHFGPKLRVDRIEIPIIAAM